MAFTVRIVSNFRHYQRQSAAVNHWTSCQYESCICVGRSGLSLIGYCNGVGRMSWQHGMYSISLILAWTTRHVSIH